MEIQLIQNKIYEIRGQRVMLDFDLAELHGVETRVLKQAVRRNIERFEGEDFMFELTAEEHYRLKESIRSQIEIIDTTVDSLRSQIVTSNTKGGRRYSPFAFSEIGVSMLSSVLRSEAAIYANRTIMRAFVSMRNYIATTSVITAELTAVRSLIEDLKRADEDTMGAVNDLSQYTREEIYGIWDAITALSERPTQTEKPRNPIGYRTTGIIEKTV